MPDNKIVPMNADANLPDHANRIADLLGGMANIQNSIAEAGGVASQFPFIGINNDGIWAYGQDRTEVEEGSEWALDIRTWQHGYIAWPDQKSKERKPLGERMVPASSPLPILSTLPDVGQPYQLQFAFELLCMSGEDAGIMALYKNGSYGAKVLVQSMVDEVRKQARIDPARLCPVVVLDIRSYFHQEWKKNIHNPVFQIQKWISFEEYDAFEKVSQSGGEQEESQPEAAPPPPPPTPEPQPEPARAGRRGRVAAPAPAPAPTPPPAPAGRRRVAGRAQPSA